MIGAGWLLSRRTSNTGAPSTDTKRTLPYPTSATSAIDKLKTYFQINTQKDQGDPASVDTIIKEVEASDGDPTVPSATISQPPPMLSGQPLSLLSWKTTAGRKSGPDNYQFGDLSKTLYKKVFKGSNPLPDPPSESPAPNLNSTVANLLGSRSAVSSESSSRDTPPNVPTSSDPRSDLFAQIRAKRRSS